MKNAKLGTKISVKVVSNAKTNQVIPVSSNRYKIKVTAPAAQGKANKAVVKVLAKYFKVKKSQVEIVSGEMTRNKIIHID